MKTKRPRNKTHLIESGPWTKPGLLLNGTAVQRPLLRPLLMALGVVLALALVFWLIHRQTFVLPSVIQGLDGEEMVLIPAGEYRMGTSEGDPLKGYRQSERAHKVWVDAFYIDKHEVTFERYDRYCEAKQVKKPDDEGWGRGHRPVINISWQEAEDYCEWAGKRLPTEAEWEKACRGKNEGKWSFGNDDRLLDDYAWYGFEKSGRRTHPVGEKKPNAYGLYDMHGNVWEWAWDYYEESYYSWCPYRNPQGPKKYSGVERVSKVLRGGAWDTNGNYLRSAYRLNERERYRLFIIGCRCAKTP